MQEQRWTREYPFSILILYLRIWHVPSYWQWQEPGARDHSELTLGNVAGCFYILIGGLILAMIVAFMEFTVRAKAESLKYEVRED